MHYFEKNVVEIKNEYTNFLINIVTPLVYEGIKNIYDRSMQTEKKFKESSMIDPSVQNPGVLKIFQIYLKDIQNLNNHMIQTEYERIKQSSKCSEWFDDLVKAVVKSNIILLTFNTSGKKCKLVNDKYHESIKIDMFIHKSYIECARIFYNYPEIFYHGYSSIDIKRNQREAYSLIKEGINEAIRKMLPIKLILEEYLKNDYIDDNNDVSAFIPQSQYTNLRSLVKKDLSENYNYDDKFHESEKNNSSFSRYSNKNYKILEDEDEDSDYENKFNELDNEMDENDKNDNITENLKDLILGKEDTNITNITEQASDLKNKYEDNKMDDNNVVKNMEIKIPDSKEKSPSSSKENLMTKKDDIFDQDKVLESIKKPKNMLNEFVNEYKKFSKSPDNNDQNKDKNISKDDININKEAIDQDKDVKIEYVKKNDNNKDNNKDKNDNNNNENNVNKDNNVNNDNNENKSNKLVEKKYSNDMDRKYYDDSVSNKFEELDNSIDKKSEQNSLEDINIKIDKKVNKYDIKAKQ